MIIWDDKLSTVEEPGYDPEEEFDFPDGTENKTDNDEEE